MVDADFSEEVAMRGMSSRFVLVGICAWISLCLLVAGWLPNVHGDLHSLWLISGLMGLVSSVGLAEAIKNDVRLQENLVKEYMHAAMTDGLTGLANRISLDRMLTNNLRETQGRGIPLSLIMIDIDHFKDFNDKWGHQAGDAVLRTVSRRMQEHFGSRAFVARYGGEEFAIVLPACRLTDAEALAESCREVIRGTPCVFRDQTFHITISCGLTSAVKNETPETLIQRADMALYTAKKMGRDTVWVSDPKRPEPLPVPMPAIPAPTPEFTEEQVIS